MARYGTAVQPGELADALKYVARGGRLAIPTQTRLTIIDDKTLARFRRAGQYLLKEDGNGFRMQEGRSSIYLFPGQLRHVIEE